MTKLFSFAFMFCTHLLVTEELVGFSQNLRMLHCVAGQRRTKEILSNIWKASLLYKNVRIQLSLTTLGRRREKTEL
jgi:hypothetical protein